MAIIEATRTVHDEGEELLEEHDVADVELDIVGEGPRQDALAMIAGPKEAESKLKIVGVTLRCEPSNPYDANAIRVEVMGQHVAYVAKAQAGWLSPRMRQTCGGIVEVSGLIVGGWKDDVSEGHYGIRAWIDERDIERVAHGYGSDDDE
jgi:hypothetical protein